MAIKDLPKYSDIRGTIRRKGRYPLVGTNVKDTIVIHHSMTSHKAKGSNPHAFANTHIDTNKWHGVAYHFVIGMDGTIFHCDDLDRRTYHAGDTNTRSIGICVIGDFRKNGANEKPTEAQQQSLYLLVKELQKTLPKLKIIKGHNECSGYSWKNCPGDTWDYKKVINGSFIKPIEKPKEVKKMAFPSSNTFKKEWVSFLEKAHKKGFIDSRTWIDKAKNGTLTEGEGASLIATIINRSKFLD